MNLKQRKNCINTPITLGHGHHIHLAAQLIINWDVVQMTLYKQGPYNRIG